MFYDLYFLCRITNKSVAVFECFRIFQVRLSLLTPLSQLNKELYIIVELLKLVQTYLSGIKSGVTFCC